MKAKPARILWRLPRSFDKQVPQRLVVVHESDNYLYLDVGSFTKQLNKGSESDMKQLFRTKDEVVRQIHRNAIKNEVERVRSLKERMRRETRELVDTRIEFLKAERKLAALKRNEAIWLGSRARQRRCHA